MFFNDELPIADLGRKDIKITREILAKGLDIGFDDNLADLSKKGFGKESVFRIISKLPEENDLF